MADGMTEWDGPVDALADPPGLPSTGWRALVLCDHASNAVPPGIDLGVAGDDMERHIAFDVGARGTVLELAKLLEAPAVMSTYSRLVIDPNRGEDDPTLVMRLYDGTIIPGNRHLDGDAIEARLEAYHRPYHRAIDGALDDMIGRGEVPVIISIHTFTPQLRGRHHRPWQIGLLYDRDRRVADPLMKGLAVEETGPDGDALCIGDNQPYSGQLRGDCMWQHGTMRGIAHVLVEIRNDLLATRRAQTEWAALLDRALRRSLPASAAADLAPIEPPAF